MNENNLMTERSELERELAEARLLIHKIVQTADTSPFCPIAHVVGHAEFGPRLREISDSQMMGVLRCKLRYTATTYTARPGTPMFLIIK